MLRRQWMSKLYVAVLLSVSLIALTHSLTLYKHLLSAYSWCRSSHSCHHKETFGAVLPEYISRTASPYIRFFLQRSGISVVTAGPDRFLFLFLFFYNQQFITWGAMAVCVRCNLEFHLISLRVQMGCVIY